MPEQSGSSREQRERTELPIERGFPIERVNEIAEKESRAGMHYRPIYTMHKWWARRMGCVFRAISLYTLLDDAESASVHHPGTSNSETLDTGGEDDTSALQKNIDSVSQSNPDALWQYYSKDVTIDSKRVLDPFMGGGTSVVEASRFGADVLGNDLNPVAWFVSKKEIEAGRADPDELRAAFESIRDEISEELKSYYRTPCPNGDHSADVMYYFWAKELDCTSCGDTVPLFNDYRVGKGRYDHKDKYSVFCPHCESVTRVEDWKSESVCSCCGHTFTPKDGTTGHGKYTCGSCGQKYSVTDAIEEQDGFDLKLYALEYYCDVCDDDQSKSKSDAKGYKSAEEADKELYEEAKSEWSNQTELREYIPDETIPEGAITASSSISGNDVFRHGYEKWTDMYNERQLLCLSKLLRAIDGIEHENAKEYLLLAFSDSLRTNCMLTTYTHARNSVEHIFKTNSFAPPAQTVDANVWGTEYGRGTFTSIWDMVMSGVEYAQSPTERYIEDGKTRKTGGFETPIGKSAEVRQGDVRALDQTDEYDAVITDPPYYDNIIYSEVSDYFYVWLKILLEGEYEGFSEKKTPRSNSIVTNPYLDKTAEEFESELEQSFSVIHRALKADGALTFTYHHSDSESWGELLESLCNVGFEVTATYPISADIGKFITGEAVSFDIVVVARPIDDTEPASWKSLRRDIYRTARRTRQQLEENRDLSRGDIGVMEMGACFREYSKHHGKVQRDGEIMSAKEVVQEIYGIIQEASDIGVEDVFIDLLDTPNPSFDDVNKLCRGTNATPEDLKEMHLYNQDDGFELGTWDNEKRQAYIQERVNGDGDEHLSDLDKLQFLRYRYEKGQSVQNYVDKWGVDDDLRELAGRLADVTGDDTYTRVLGDRDITNY
jgi:adenine-specific DNA methylase